MEVHSTKENQIPLMLLKIRDYKSNDQIINNKVTYTEEEYKEKISDDESFFEIQHAHVFQNSPPLPIPYQ